MMELKKFPASVAILGGDHRMICTASAFAADGCAVTFWGVGKNSAVQFPEDAIRNAELIVLPIPMTRDGQHLNAPLSEVSLPLSELYRRFRPGQTVACGMAPPDFQRAVREKGCRFFEYNASEVFAIRNALATAEGAIAIALCESPELLWGASVAVLGFGRIGKQVCRLLLAMGAKVTLYARRDADLTFAATMGCTPQHLSKAPQQLREQKLIFNTIPVKILELEDCKLAEDCLIIDLAPIYSPSEKPRLIRAAALPAKYSPTSAGMLIHDCIVSHLAESGATL